MTHPNPWLMVVQVSRGTFDEDEVRRALSILLEPGSLHEIRGLPSGRSRYVSIDRLDEAVAMVGELSEDRSLYYTLNPSRPGLTKGTKNADVLHRRWLLVDVDPVKPDAARDESATDAEKEATRAVALTILEHLSRLGWPAPVLIDSGNGFHLLYRVDLPNDSRSRAICSKALKRLAELFNCDTAAVDKAVHNAARIAKLPGTWARKGGDSAARPHRLCRLLAVPEEIQPVHAELIEALSHADEPNEVDVGAEASPPFASDPWLTQVNLNGHGDLSHYVRTACDKEVARVALAPVGDRNNTLNDASFRLGTLVGAGAASEADVEKQLLFAAARAGLGEAEARATVRSGLEAGIASPRQLPEFSKGAKASSGHGVGPLAPPPTDADVVTVCLASVKAVQVEWLIPGRVPLGKLTLLAGMPKTGKSFLTMDWSARVSTGAEIPCGLGECMPLGSVVLLSAEDDLDDTVKPRLIAAGADCDKIHALTTVRQPDGTFGPFNLSYLPHLERAITRFRDTKLVIIDPITHYIGSKVDDHKVAQLRTLLGPLRDLAAKLHIAVLVISHFNKGTSTNALHRVIGSSAYTALARANWVLVRDPKDPKRRLLLNAGTNLAEDPPGLAYRIKDGRLEWEDAPVFMDASEALQEEQSESRKATGAASPTRTQAAIQWLTDLFSRESEVPSEEVFRQAEAKGLSRDAVFKARKEMPWIRAEKSREHNGAWVWRRDPSILPTVPTLQTDQATAAGRNGHAPY